MKTQSVIRLEDSSRERQEAKITQKLIPMLKYSKADNKKDIWWDTELSGFGVRLYPSGKKSFVVQYRINRRQRLKAIGSCELLTATGARERAKKELVKVIDGIDPLSGREQIHKAHTFKELCNNYMERYSKPHKKSWNTDQGRIDKYLIPKFGNRIASTIDNEDISKFHLDHKNKPSPQTANRLVKLISGIYTKSIEWRMLPDNFRHPVKGITFFDEYSRDRYITTDELPRLIEAIDREDVYSRSAVWLALFTGLRKTELLSLTWGRVDFDLKQVAIRDTKNKKPLFLPLTDEALAVIEKIPRVQGNDHLFVGRKAGGHLSDIKRPWDRIRKRAGVEDIIFHDLRRTLGSWLAQSGNSLHLIGKVLNHKDQRTTETYARFAQNDLREALNATSKQMLGVAGKGKSADIIKLKEA